MLNPKLMPIKLMALDLDGTLLVDWHTLTHPVHAAVQAASRQDVHVVIATGREYPLTAKFYHQLILMDNVQTSLLQEVDDGPIRESVRYAINRGKPGGRYIFSTSNCLFHGMPLENYHIMLDEYEKLAWY
jgi:phosphoserine phosphatase